MHIATRFPPHADPRQCPVGQRQGDMDDSGAESESNVIRRKFARTTTDPEDTTDFTFRKPALPASATRQQGLERRPSLSQRRKSTFRDREHARVPSGPRDFPSPGKPRIASFNATAPAVSDPLTVSPRRPALPTSKSDVFAYASSRPRPGDPTAPARLSYGPSTNDSDSPPTPVERTADSFDFLPDISFDDFQSTIKGYDRTSPTLSDFPAIGGGKVLSKDEEYYRQHMATSGASVASARSAAGQEAKLRQQAAQEGLVRASSLRQRIDAGRQASGGQLTYGKDPPAPSPSAISSLRSRRQSSVPQTSNLVSTPPAPPASRTPRKSVGPGLLSGMMKGPQGQPPTSFDATGKPALARTSSLTKARRTTLHASASAGADLPRLSTLTAPTQSRQNKVKSLQPPPREPQDPNSTPSSSKSLKVGQNGTPSSSGNRRQSVASGRASGLGARTVSPTDVRRHKRISMMNPPPMPTHVPKAQPTPPEEITNPMNTGLVPRLAQPSPSLIPRKTSSVTPTSARASPENRQLSGGGGVSLVSKSSYSSLTGAPLNGSSSRLPTPKPRNGTQPGSALAQYADQYPEDDTGEFVPPVPAIPKAYESPKDTDHPPFFSSSRKSTYSGFNEAISGDRWSDGSSLHTPQFPHQTPRASLDVPSEAASKRSGEYVRPAPRRTNTTSSNNGVPDDINADPVPPKSARTQPDPNGRKNANLQPLRLPPLNLVPINTRTPQPGGMPNQSHDTDAREDYTPFHTPEPKRGPKTPSTPMTASKATFFRRHEEHDKALRSSSSHYALRDVLGMDADGNMVTKFWDDPEVENGQGLPIASTAMHRNAITPFASGSLPKSSGEFARFRSRPSGEYDDDYSLGDFENFKVQASKPQGPRQRTHTATTVRSSMKSPITETPTSLESPVIDQQAQLEGKKEGEKKESSGGGLRRKLSLGWRRASSKAANHADNKNSPGPEPAEKEERRSRLQKRQSAMPPPKLPASATWTGDVPSLPSSTRPSMDSLASRRKSHLPSSISSTNLPGEEQTSAGLGGIKTRSLHSEQPMPVNGSAATRASSWAILGSNQRSAATARSTSGSKHKFTASTFSAIVKDKDDVAADDDMLRLSKKRKDVDSAARETEQLKKRAVARSPVTAESVLHDRGLFAGSSLNVFERGEIIDYEQDGIYFTGTRTARKIIGTLGGAATDGSKDGKDGNNFGYDDERGDYNIVLGDHLAYRYEVVDLLGKGSFGQVVRCVDHKDGGIVAVKIIRNKKRFHQQALVEVGILGRLRDWDPDGVHATLSITSSFYFRSHLCIVTPCLSINLYELIRAHNFAGFNLQLIRRFARQLLACLTLLQTKRIIHCDLKPENILLCEARKADVRVIDFGSSCREEEKVYTYIQSRFYRSPEVILGSTYGLGIDMWSLGCILAELWTGYPLFPGENEQEQLACIMEIFGPPDRHLVDRCTRKKLFFDSVGKPRVTVSSKGRRRRPSSKTLQQALKSDDDAFVDFVARCLRWDPDRRLKPSDAVAHPFITHSPFHQRPGIPDEARRAARVRSSVIGPTTTTSSSSSHTIPSPTKRSTAATTATAAGGNAFANNATPAKDRKVLSETPQTAVRTSTFPPPPPPSSYTTPTTTNLGFPQSNKPGIAGTSRRHSTLLASAATSTAHTASSAAVANMAGNKRASNGAVLSAAAHNAAGGFSGGGNNGGGGAGGFGQHQHQQQQYITMRGDMARLAAKESMGAATAAAAAATASSPAAATAGASSVAATRRRL